MLSSKLEASKITSKSEASEEDEEEEEPKNKNLTPQAMLSMLKGDSIKEQVSSHTLHKHTRVSKQKTQHLKI